MEDCRVLVLFNAALFTLPNGESASGRSFKHQVFSVFHWTSADVTDLWIQISMNERINPLNDQSLTYVSSWIHGDLMVQVLQDHQILQDCYLVVSISDRWEVLKDSNGSNGNDTETWQVQYLTQSADAQKAQIDTKKEKPGDPTLNSDPLARQKCSFLRPRIFLSGLTVTEGTNPKIFMTLCFDCSPLGSFQIILPLSFPLCRKRLFAPLLISTSIAFSLFVSNAV